MDGGQRAVIWSRFSGGVQDVVIEEGTHFRIPFVQYPTLFDVSGWSVGPPSASHARAYRCAR